MSNALERLDTMYAHRGDCRYCGPRMVVMFRDYDLKLCPDRCYCVKCGQRYYMDLSDLQLDEWELEQWSQKANIE